MLYMHLLDFPFIISKIKLTHDSNLCVNIKEKAISLLYNGFDCITTRFVTLRVAYLDAAVSEIIKCC